MLGILPLSPGEASDAERVRDRLDDILADDPDEPALLLDEEDLLDLEHWRAATREVRNAFGRAIAASRPGPDAWRDAPDGSRSFQRRRARRSGGRLERRLVGCVGPRWPVGPAHLAPSPLGGVHGPDGIELEP